jgi:lipopolysaccharide/colanic/teichoic acid biosynthesis glycosyltransferase
VDYDQFGKTLELWNPRQIVVSADAAARIDPSAFLALRLKGVSVNLTLNVYEELLGRVCCAGQEPVDMLLSQTHSGNTQAMAFQAIYTNLIGLTLLLAAAPLIAVTSIVIALFSGRGPVIETEACCGLRNIPFRRMRFRTRRSDGTGAHTRVGALISRLRLGSLPLLFNVVRGEMALFGPRPVRCEFVGPLTEIVPFYSMRSSVKPGILSWGAVQSRRYQVCTDVLTEIEYDLYYVKHGSPLLDFEILMRLIFGGRRDEASRGELAPAAQ